MNIKEELGKHHKDFQNLTDQDIQKLQEVSVARSYKKGQVLFNFGDERSHVFFLVSGVIKLEKVDDTDTFTYLHFKKAKGLFLTLISSQIVNTIFLQLLIQILKLFQYQSKFLKKLLVIITNN